jgi:hypothetical protein
MSSWNLSLVFVSDIRYCSRSATPPDLSYISAAICQPLQTSAFQSPVLRKNRQTPFVEKATLSQHDCYFFYLSDISDFHRSSPAVGAVDWTPDLFCFLLYFFQPLLTTRPPLWSSGQSSWLQIRRPGIDSRHYQKNVVGLERGPLCLVSTTEEILDRKVAAPV